jgi:MFS family permease
MKIFATKHQITLILLCLGYFIDFYDLTIMSVSYSDLIQEQFNISDTTKIQQTYLLISNFQTLGIFIGAVLFGVLGDRVGRAKAIRYSILLYSIATLAAVYVHSLSWFIFLRVIAYVGLASEFATSSILILELFSVKSATWGSAFLYSFGVLGGILSIFMGMYSWKSMFILGGVIGILIYFGRSKIQESEVYLYARRENKPQQFGDLSILFFQRKHLFRLIQYFLMILPYFLLITIMFIFPNYIIVNYSLGYATQILLLGFFCGNIISSLLSAACIQCGYNYKNFMFMCLCSFLVLMPLFDIVSESYLFFYSVGLGLMGGGYTILLTQQAARDFPIHIRSVACNCLFALGRASSILFNLLISAWLIVPEQFILRALLTIVIVFLLASISLLCNKTAIE